MPPITIRTARQQLEQQLEQLYEPEEALALAWLGLEHVFDAPKLRLLSRSQDELSPEQEQKLTELTHRLLQHEPIQYITGKVEFCGLELHVRPGVLIPRPETEDLAYHIINRHKQQPGLHVLDVGTGSGCLALALAKHLPQAKVSALDVKEEALKVAKENAERLGLKATFILADALNLPPDLLQPHTLHLQVSNPPYVLQSEESLMRPNVLQHEPHTALFVPDTDPLLFYRAILHLGLRYLAPGGQVYFETNERYAEEVAALARELGYTAASAFSDMFGKPRFVQAQQP